MLWRRLPRLDQPARLSESTSPTAIQTVSRPPTSNRRASCQLNVKKKKQEVWETPEKTSRGQSSLALRPMHADDGRRAQVSRRRRIAALQSTYQTFCNSVPAEQSGAAGRATNAPPLPEYVRKTQQVEQINALIAPGKSLSRTNIRGISQACPPVQGCCKRDVCQLNLATCHI